MKSDNPKSRRQGQPFSPYRMFNGIFIPEAICKHRTLSLGAKLVYGRLCRYGGKGGEAFPAMPTLGSEVGLGAKQTRRYVRELEKSKLIRVHHHRGLQSHYFFLWHAIFEAPNIPLPESGVPTPPGKGRPTPPANGSQRESIEGELIRRESVKTDYQPTNRKISDSNAGRGSPVTEPLNEDGTPKPTSMKLERGFSEVELRRMSYLLNCYGVRRKMQHHMQEDAPTTIVRRCLEIVDGTPLADIAEILHFKCVYRHLDPGTANGPQGWGWFPAVIENELKARRNQVVPLEDPNRKIHLSDFAVVSDPNMTTMTSAFDTLDELEPAA